MNYINLTQLPIKLGLSCLIAIFISVLLLTIRRVSTYLIWLINERKISQLRSIKIKNYELIHVDRISKILILFIRSTQAFISFILLYVFMLFVLAQFPWTEHLHPHFYKVLIHGIRGLGHVIVGFAPDLLAIFVILVVVRTLLKVIHTLFREIEIGHLHFANFHREWAKPTYKLVRFFVLVFSFAAIFPYLPGSKSSAFQGVSVFMGILFSIGSSSAVGNMVSGILLIYMRPFQLGDRVKIADTEGDIIEKSFLVTRIKTIKNVEITIPNSLILGSHITNYSSSSEREGLILNARLSVGYHVPWQKVHELLIRSALATQNVLNHPKPFVYQAVLNDFYVVYEINAFTRMPNLMNSIYSDLHQNIQENFRLAGIDITSPHFMTLTDSSNHPKRST